MTQLLDPAPVRCTRCGEHKQVDPHFRLVYVPSIDDYRCNSWCRQCVSERAKIWRGENPDRNKQAKAAWYVANRERILAEARAKYAALSDDEKAGSVRRLSEWNAANPERARATIDAWRRRNPDKAKRMAYDSQNRRRARLRNNGVEPYRRLDIFERDKFTCWICGKRRAARNLSIDHLIPISHGGPDAPWNVRAACITCNVKRGAARTGPAAQPGLF